MTEINAKDIVKALEAKNNGYSPRQVGFYVFGVNPEEDPAFGKTIPSVRDAATADDYIYIPNNKEEYTAESIVESLKRHMASLPDGTKTDIFIEDHGTQEVFSYNLIRYDELFKKIPEGVNVFVDNCFSGAAMQYADELPTGAMVFSSVSNKSLGYANENKRDSLTRQNETNDLTAAELFKIRLTTTDFQRFAQENTLRRNNKYKDQYTADELTSNPTEVIPSKFAISGFGVIDLAEKVNSIKGMDLSQEAENLKKVNNTGRGYLELDRHQDNYKIDTVAEKLQNKEALDQDELGIAYALTFQHMEDTGEIDKFITYAKKQTMQPDNQPLIPPRSTEPNQTTEFAVPLDAVEDVIAKGGLLSRYHGHSNKEAMMVVQAFLDQHGYKGENGQPLEMDGIIGKQAEAAIKQFQKENGLKPDGIVGKDMLEAMQREHAKMVAAQIPQNVTASLAAGSLTQADDTHQPAYLPKIEQTGIILS